MALSSLISEGLFNEMLKHRNDHRCPGNGFYNYSDFITAAESFREFGNTGNTNVRKREIAAFFGQTSNQTSGAWEGAPDGRYAWGYCHVNEVGDPLGDYCDTKAKKEWPCARGRKYYGRGPIQLRYNYNYGPAGKAIREDLLNNPDLVATDANISFKAALWYWMTRHDSKPSCHDVMTGQWKPSRADMEAGRVSGYGITFFIINDGTISKSRVDDGIGFYKRYCDMLGVSYGDNLDCYNQRPFA